MHLIAFFGPKGSGKDAAASIALDLWRPRSAVSIAFADPLRWACDALGLPPDATRARRDEPCAELDGHTGREALVKIGEAIRSLAPAYFARLGVERARDLAHEDDALVVITDGRREAEVQAVRDAGGLCVWVDCPATVRARRVQARTGVSAPMADLAVALTDATVQDGARALCHREVDNSGDLAHLRHQVAAMLPRAQ